MSWAEQTEGPPYLEKVGAPQNLSTLQGTQCQVNRGSCLQCLSFKERPEHSSWEEAQLRCPIWRACLPPTRENGWTLNLSSPFRPGFLSASSLPSWNRPFPGPYPGSPPCICPSVSVSGPVFQPPVCPTPKVLCPLLSWDSINFPQNCSGSPYRTKEETQWGPTAFSNGIQTIIPIFCTLPCTGLQAHWVYYWVEGREGEQDCCLTPTPFSQRASNLDFWHYIYTVPGINCQRFPCNFILGPVTGPHCLWGT